MQFSLGIMIGRIIIQILNPRLQLLCIPGETTVTLARYCPTQLPDDQNPIMDTGQAGVSLDILQGQILIQGGSPHVKIDIPAVSGWLFQ